MENRFAVILLFALLSTGFAQFGNDPQILQIEPSASVNQVVPGIDFQISVVVHIQKGYHINSHTPAADFFIPTRLEFKPQSEVEILPVRYPEHKLVKFSFSEEKLAVYEETITIAAGIRVASRFVPDSLRIEGKLEYQGCDDKTCFAPSSVAFTLMLPIADDQTPGEDPGLSGLHNSGELPDTDSVLTANERRAQDILSRGLPYAVMAFFLIGLGLNLTPCVYPIIPLTVSYFAGQKSTNRFSSFLNALFYLFGIALSFSLLGLLSALAGKQWGFLFTSPWFVVAIALIILSMAASLFGVFEVSAPSWLLSRVGGTKGGTLGALFMGLTVGVVIAPCAAGMIIGLVGLVAKMGLVAQGTLLFFVMGIGLGLPYLILGTFSGLLSKLPQSGMWMIWVRKLFAFVLIGVAIYFLLPQLERVADSFAFATGFLALFSGLLLGFLDRQPGYTRGFKIGKAVFGLLLMVYGLFAVGQAIEKKAQVAPTQSAIAWNVGSIGSIESALVAGKPTFIDFYADWCAPCKELDQKTFADSAVVRLARQITMIKVDCTRSTEESERLMKQFQVSGMPTLVYIDREGNELTELREIGFIPPAAMAEKFTRLLTEQ